jgi:hypothetical protein
MDTIIDSIDFNELNASSESSFDKPKVKKPKKKRCPVCNKKIGLLTYTCKCGLEFCVNHIQPELHNCSYDHKTEAKKLLNDRLIKVVNEKVEKI